MLKTCLAFFVALGLSICGLAPIDAGNWERFRGPNGTGIAADKDVPVKFDESSGILWKLAIPGLGNSSPVVWGKRLFVQTALPDGSQRLLVCVDVIRGKELWSRGIPGAKAPTHARNTLASATPATDGQAVFIPFWDGKEVFMVAYDFEGKLLWNKGLGRWVSQHGTGASPILYKDKVILANDMDSVDPRTKAPVAKSSTLFALSKKTGEILWQVPRVGFRACYSAPCILERPGNAAELLVTSTTALTSYNPEDGTENWHWSPRFVS
jgi:outer membrane protein assembly factor BamB